MQILTWSIDGHKLFFFCRKYTWLGTAFPFFIGIEIFEILIFLWSILIYLFLFLFFLFIFTSIFWIFINIFCIFFLIFNFSVSSVDVNRFSGKEGKGRGARCTRGCVSPDVLDLARSKVAPRRQEQKTFVIEWCTLFTNQISDWIGRLQKSFKNHSLRHIVINWLFLSVYPRTKNDSKIICSSRSLSNLSVWFGKFFIF